MLAGLSPARGGRTVARPRRRPVDTGVSPRDRDRAVALLTAAISAPDPAVSGDETRTDLEALTDTALIDTARSLLDVPTVQQPARMALRLLKAE